MNELNWFGKLLFAIPITFIAIIMFAAYWNNYVEPFSKKHRIIIMELRRAKDSRRKYWRKRLFKNYLKLIPVVGWIMKLNKKNRQIKHFRSHRYHHRKR